MAKSLDRESYVISLTLMNISQCHTTWPIVFRRDLHNRKAESLIMES